MAPSRVEGIVTIRRTGGLAQRRIGDEERQDCADLLAEHHAHGRLSQEEFEERLGVALTAQTARDLGHVLADLPSGGRRPARPSPPANLPPLVAMGGVAAAVVLLSSIILVLLGESVADSVGGTLLLLSIPGGLGVVGGFLAAWGVQRRREQGGDHDHA
jgi:Domain of unknown function (DUF1707)